MENFQKQTAYEILDTLKETLERYTDEENDQRIKERRDKLKKGYEEQLKTTTDFKKKAKIELKLQQIEEAYHKINTAQKREEYAKQQKQQTDEASKEKMRQIYSHVSEYKPDLINTKKGTKEKMLKKEEEPSKEYPCADKENRQLRIKRTSRINFQNWTGMGELYIDEYEIRRIIDGEERVDIVYTHLSLPSLKIQEETGKPINDDYYDCVVNELLSEEMIKGSKYNSGYIGQIEQDEEGNYYITLDKGKLNAREQEMLSAVMMMKQREANMTEERGEDIK